jgi:hypothetical protein
MIEAICMDYVIIAGQRVKRPSWFSRLYWLEYWEEVRCPPRRDLIT